jgi:tungstate transport system permease protein
MSFLLEGVVGALRLIAELDEETFSAVITTLKASTLSITLSLLIGLPAGFSLGYFDFFLKKQLRAVSDTLLSLPTVVVGLFVYAFISQRGPLGSFAILFTVPGIVVAQTLLVLPIVISLTATAIEGSDPRLKPTLVTLGAGKKEIMLSSLYEARFAVAAAAVTAYGRAISEVGVSMMIGGNIKWSTRTITTAIALESGKGDFAMGIALGIILLLLAFTVNLLLMLLRRMSGI